MKHHGDSCKLSHFAATHLLSALVTPCLVLQLREKYIKDEDLSDTKATYRTIRKALATLNDPFTRFLEPQQFAALRRGTAGSVTGVGLEIGFENRGGDSNSIVVRYHTNVFSVCSYQSAWTCRKDPAERFIVLLHPAGSSQILTSYRVTVLTGDPAASMCEAHLQ